MKKASDQMCDKASRNRVLAILREAKPELEKQFEVKALTLFGSVARDTASDSSDVDILVDFERAATARGFFGLQVYLEDLLNRKVDLVTKKALRAELIPYVQRDAVSV